jgi:hypothetical protein
VYQPKGNLHGRFAAGFIGIEHDHHSLKVLVELRFLLLGH